MFNVRFVWPVHDPVQDSALKLLGQPVDHRARAAAMMMGLDGCDECEE